jgi:hypothetical protein
VADDIETQATAWIGDQADYWKRRARDAEATVEQLRTTMAGDDRERIEQIQAERDAMPEDERIRREAADAPMLRIQLACLAGENQRLKDEMERTVQSAANEVWEKAGFNALIHWKQRATQAESVAAEWQAACEAHQADGEALTAAIERVRRMAQVWVDIRPTYPTATCEGHGIAYAGQQILAALDAPSGADSPASGRTDVPRHTEATREAGEAQEAAE